jgi:hypothetical protein
MPEGYRLDVSGMNRLVDRLAEAEDRMTKANNALRGATAKDLGSFVLDRAGNDFRDRWEYGIGKLAESAEKVVEGLNATQKQYKDVDQATAQYFPAGGGGGSGGDSAIGKRMGGPV